MFMLDSEATTVIRNARAAIAPGASELLSKLALSF